MKPRTRLRLRMIAVCVALGVIVNVVVAWACAMRFDPQTAVFRPLDFAEWSRIPPGELDRLGLHPKARQYSDATVVIGDEREWGAERRITSVVAYWSAAIRVGSYTGPFQSDDMFEVRIRAGWPSMSIEGTRRAAINSISGSRFEYSWLARLGSVAGPQAFGATGSMHPRLLLPLKPLWPGCAINTLLYAALAWLVLFVPFALRRSVRRRRNRCEHCGYPRGVSAVCSECGTPHS